MGRLERGESSPAEQWANRHKPRRKIAIAHGEDWRARGEQHHKQALTLVRENQVRQLDDLNIAVATLEPDFATADGAADCAENP